VIEKQEIANTQVTKSCIVSVKMVHVHNFIMKNKKT